MTLENTVPFMEQVLLLENVKDLIPISSSGKVQQEAFKNK